MRRLSLTDPSYGILHCEFTSRALTLRWKKECCLNFFGKIQVPIYSIGGLKLYKRNSKTNKSQFKLCGHWLQSWHLNFPNKLQTPILFRTKKYLLYARITHSDNWVFPGSKKTRRTNFVLCGEITSVWLVKFLWLFFG